jgi:hypothetical protein
MESNTAADATYPDTADTGKSECGDRAAVLGQKIHLENGVATAVEILEQTIHKNEQFVMSDLVFTPAFVQSGLSVL